MEKSFHELAWTQKESPLNLFVFFFVANHFQGQYFEGRH